MTHTSGLGSYFDEDLYEGSSGPSFASWTTTSRSSRTKPAFNPGERFQYSNTGMFLLGVIIEKVAGED